MQCNVRDPASVKAAVDKLVADVGLPDVRRYSSQLPGSQYWTSDPLS